MSFNINGPSNKPAIQEAQNMMNNGGGGNLGYFQRQQKEEETKILEEDTIDFFQKEPDPEFIEEQEKQNKTMIEKFFELVKNAFKTQKTGNLQQEKLQKKEAESSFLTLSKKPED